MSLTIGDGEFRKQLAGRGKTFLALSKKNNSTRGGMKERGRDAGILSALGVAMKGL